MISTTSSTLWPRVSPSSYEVDIAKIDCAAGKFSINSATTESWCSFASQLVNKMYSWRGYGSTFRVGDRPDQTTFVATDTSTGCIVGTITVGTDGDDGLQADKMYRDVSDKLRAQDYSLCEFTKLAIDHRAKSKYLLGALFHVAVIYAHHILRRDMLIIEINPSHESFYERLLNFERCGEEKLNPRVSAPSILMKQELRLIAEQARMFGGMGNLCSDRSLYPYFLSRRDVAIARARLDDLPYETLEDHYSMTREEVFMPA